MLSSTSIVTRDFEIWPGRLRLAVSGPAALDAIDAAMDAARELSLTVLADAELFASGISQVLPRGRAGRLVVEAMLSAGEIVSASMLPPSLVAMPGAICDVVFEAMYEVAGNAGGAGFISVSLGDAASFFVASGNTLPFDVPLPSIFVEMIAAHGSGRGGIAMTGAHGFMPTKGVVDLAVVTAGDAALAAAVATILADASARPEQSAVPAFSRDRLVSQAWKGRVVSSSLTVQDAGDIWDALSVPVRQGSLLKEKKLLLNAIVCLKGRGRMIGALDGNRLLRAGVSEWR